MAPLITYKLRAINYRLLLRLQRKVQMMSPTTVGQTSTWFTKDSENLGTNSTKPSLRRKNFEKTDIEDIKPENDHKCNIL